MTDDADAIEQLSMPLQMPQAAIAPNAPILPIYRNPLLSLNILLIPSPLSLPLAA